VNIMFRELSNKLLTDHICAPSSSCSFLPAFVYSGQALAKDKILANLARQSSLDDDDGVGRIDLCTCFWRRDLDFQPPSGRLDIGVCASEMPARTTTDGAVFMRETGDDASYAEGWRRFPNLQVHLWRGTGIENGHGGRDTGCEREIVLATPWPTEGRAAALQCSLLA
jgi:hypothetical protein